MSDVSLEPIVTGSIPSNDRNNHLKVAHREPAKNPLRRVLIVFAAICSLNASMWSDPKEKPNPPVDGQLLASCRLHMTSLCLADIAWALAREEERDVRLSGLAEKFAQLKQWERAHELLSRIHAKEDVYFSLGQKAVDGERLALELSEGNVTSLSTTKEGATLNQAATRLVGYLPDRDRSGRLNIGLPFTRINADRTVALDLLNHWASLSPNEIPLHHRINLASAYFLLDEESRSREIAFAISSHPGIQSRSLIDLLLLLGAQDRALEVAKIDDDRYRPHLMFLVAQSFARDRHDADRAASVALEAAAAALSQGDLDSLKSIVDLLSRLDRTDDAQLLAIKAEIEAQGPSTFRPHQLSKAGAIFGAARDIEACLRLQTAAIEASTSGTMGFGFVAKSVGYGKGQFDLLPDLMESIALRRFECGDAGALNEANVHQLSRAYCSLNSRGLLGINDIVGKPDKVPVLADAAECHYMRSEPKQAISLLLQLEAEAQASRSTLDRFTRAYEAADVACVYSTPDHCKKNLLVTGSALLDRAAARTVSSTIVVDFAVAWQFRVEQ